MKALLTIATFCLISASTMAGDLFDNFKLVISSNNGASYSSYSTNNDRNNRYDRNDRNNRYDRYDRKDDRRDNRRPEVIVEAPRRGHYETVSERYFEPGYWATTQCPAVYETRRDYCGRLITVMVKPARTERTWVEGTWKCREVTRWVAAPDHRDSRYAYNGRR